ncbi:xylose transport system permease XylH [Escherichia coli]|uniref:Xylose transport system permease XylH n=1 Tax=Escherichia coli TaxID=562 RepID=A0A2X3K0Z0_ECOLX|nr:xylose transport system permease XylH [Escherichia coli]
MIAAIIAIMLFFTWTTDGAYLSARNVSNLLRQTAITGILAVGMVFVIISAEIDPFRRLNDGAIRWRRGDL